ncbi:MAG: efflux RND transporter periplasmic adaptor subunit [Synergistaceae bacterium]|nr:efflux RND transporter periplasmic adaptor subunit [Synergistaceae bacterium]MBR0044689.1 efflux RND transporter periplasmic adaptor subunit [Synergistaceae bacterium]
MKKFLQIVIGIAVIIAICFGLGKLRPTREQAPEPEVIRPVRAIRIMNNSNANYVKNYFGTLRGGRRVDLSFRVSGTLNKILIDKGASVKKGDLLAVLDKRDFNTNLKQAQSAQAQAHAQYNDAVTNFRRYENLYKQRAVSKAQYDAAKTQVEVTRSAMNAAAAKTASVRDALKDTELRAPFDGVIADRMVENFQDINAKQAIFSLQDISTLEIVFNIPDNDILLAPLPNDVSLEKMTANDGEKLFRLRARFEAIPDREYTLKLKEFTAQADARTNTYPVTATMPQQEDLTFLPGMAVNVEAVFFPELVAATSGGENKYIVPAAAILNLNNKNYVWRFNSFGAGNNTGEVSRVEINIVGPKNGGAFEIESDKLNNQDVIVTAGVNFLRDNQTVRVFSEAK